MAASCVGWWSWGSSRVSIAQVISLAASEFEAVPILQATGCWRQETPSPPKLRLTRRAHRGLLPPQHQPNHSMPRYRVDLRTSTDKRITVDRHCRVSHCRAHRSRLIAGRLPPGRFTKIFHGDDCKSVCLNRLCWIGLPYVRGLNSQADHSAGKWPSATRPRQSTAKRRLRYMGLGLCSGIKCVKIEPQ